MNVQEHIKELNDKAAKVQQEVRKHDKDAAGHQGDVYCHPISKRPAAWNVENTEQSRQVALGQTVGSRHHAQGPVRIFWPDDAARAAEACPVDLFRDDPAMRQECLGPVIGATGEWTLAHPEHDDHVFQEGIYLITYQADLRTKRRVID